MEIKLILCDLDGTLLRSDKTISARSISVLNECRAKGILVGFSTSRGKSNIKAYEKQIIPDILICNGGGSILYKGQQIFSSAFSLEETRAMLAKAYEVCGDNAEITLDLLDKIYWNRRHDKSTDYDFGALYDDFRDFKERAFKICVQTEDVEKARLIGESVPGCDMLPFSDIPWYKYSPSDSTKEKAIEFLCGHIGISTGQIVAFGDDHNDIGMLKMCGKGVAMKNAIPEVKAAAAFETLSNDEDGVAAFLERELLGL
ncbi:MAG: Cof-type HAD-IIB family hydrolase [Treponemataceae bacterium]|nr:Cof-type HAD-IIB family hydrolase [Treponemataceae bacterium]